MTEKDLRDNLRDWNTEVGLMTITERNDAIKELTEAEYTLRADTTEDLDRYDKAMTHAEQRLGLTLPTSSDIHNQLFEYACKLWLGELILAKQVSAFDVDNKKTSQIKKNLTEYLSYISKRYDTLREEAWGKGKTSQRTTTGDLEIATHSIVSDLNTQIEAETVLTLDNELEN